MTSNLERLRFHHQIAARSKDGWNARLAALLGTDPPTISKVAAGHRATKGVVGKLNALHAREFFTALGILPTIVGNLPDSRPKIGQSDDQVDWVSRLAMAETRELYAACCLRLGILLREDHKARAYQTAQQIEAAHQHGRLVRVVDRKAFKEAPFAGHACERAAVQSILDALRQAPGAVEVWSAPDDGCHGFLQQIASLPGIGKQYSMIVHLNGHHPWAHPQTLSSAALLAGQVTGERGAVAKAGQVAEWLDLNGALLIVPAASALWRAGDQPDPQGETAFWRELIGALKAPARVYRGQRNCARVLFQNWDGDTTNLLGNEIRRIQFRPRIPQDQTEAFLDAAIDDACTRRGITAQAVRNDGPRWKQLRHHYLLDSTAPGARPEFSPSSIRFRAACASNLANLSPFDPTQGIRAMLGDTDAFPDIDSLAEELHAYIRVGRTKPGWPDSLLALRLVSTGVYWFSDAMFARLRERGAVSMAGQGDKIALQAKTCFAPGIQEPREIEGKGAVAPLLLKAVVQQDWRAEEPGQHSAIHRHVGEILLEGTGEIPMKGHKDKKEWKEGELKGEYPFDPPWGDQALILRAEAIRHLARACETAASAERETILLMMRTAINGLDGNSPRGAGLTEAKGQYRLKLEMLTLHLGALHFGRSPGDLPRERTSEALWLASLYREVAFARERLLDTDGALDAIRCGLDVLTHAGGRQRHLVVRLQLLCEQVTILLARSDCDAAAEVKGMAERLIQAQHDRALGALPLPIAKQERRLQARTAMWHLAKGDPDQAIRELEKLGHAGELTPMIGDRAIRFVDALLASKQPYNLGRAWELCERVRRESDRRDRKDLTLRFEIRRARIIRQIAHRDGTDVFSFPGVAQGILDDVGLDLARVGGSALTFKEFQIEAAQTLIDLDRPRYAFAAYAWPCLGQLAGTGAKVLQDQAMAACNSAISAARLCPAEVEDAYLTSDFYKEYIRNLGPTRDPLNSLPVLPTPVEIAGNLTHLQQRMSGP